MRWTRDPEHHISTFVAVTSLIVALITLALAYVAVPLPNPDTHEAQRFIKKYYVTARNDPANAWNMLTDEFQKDYRVDHNGSDSPYARFFRSMLDIEVQQVAGMEGNSKWRAVVVYEPRNGQPAYTRVHIFELKCPPRTKILRTSCNEHTVQLDTSSVLQEETP
jgi:hypothetical protein